MACSSIRRASMRATVCRCLRGASRSARKISSTTGLNGSNFDARGGSFFRVAGHADAIAATTVRARREVDDHSPWQTNPSASGFRVR
jgi:uncharacterized protein (UPF0303 family)